MIQSQSVVGTPGRTARSPTPATRQRARALVAGSVMVQVAFTFVCLEEPALVIIDPEAIVQHRGAAHDLEIMFGDFERSLAGSAEAVDNRARAGRVIAAERRVEQEAVLKDVIVARRLDIGRALWIIGIFVFERMDDADLARVAAVLEGADSARVGDHHVVLGLEAFMQAHLLAERPGAFHVAIHGRCGDFVECEPMPDVIRVFLETEARVRLEGVDVRAVQEIAVGVDGERGVEMVEGDEGFDAMRSTAREKIMIECHALGIRLARAFGEDAAPGDRDADPVHAELFAEGEVGIVAVIEVAGGLGREAPLFGKVIIPCHLAFAIRSQ